MPVFGDTRNRVLILCGPNIRHLSTCATIIDAGVKVVGICICNQKSVGMPLKYLLRSIKREGLLTIASRILGRLYYCLFNYTLDKSIHNEMYDQKEIYNTVSLSDCDVFHTADYSSEDTVKWIAGLQPDIFVVHTPYWIDKTVRELPRKGVVIGGHPGLTPHYRGAHSAFWAIYKNKPEDVGCSIFWLDGGADTGDVIQQEKLDIEVRDSYFTLGWKGMRRQAEMQAQVILNYDKGEEIPRVKNRSIPENSYYGVPGLIEYLRYRKIQNRVR